MYFVLYKKRYVCKLEITRKTEFYITFKAYNTSSAFAGIEGTFSVTCNAPPNNPRHPNECYQQPFPCFENFGAAVRPPDLGHVQNRRR